MMTTRSERISPFNVKSPRNPMAENSPENLKLISLDGSFKNFNLDEIENISLDSRKSYEDLLDRCHEQERLLGFHETIREEADRLIKELESASDSDFSPSSKIGSLAHSNDNCSEAGPITADEDICKAEIFQEASEFDFDYLSKIGGNKRVIRESRESLFLKFDPLAVNSSTPEGEPVAKEASAQPERHTDEMSTPKRSQQAGSGGGGGEEKTPVSKPPPPSGHSTPVSALSSATKPSRPPSGTATPILRNEILSKEISKLQDLMMKQESSYQDQISACSEEIDELRKKLAELEAVQPTGNSEELLKQASAEADKLRKQVHENNEQKKQLMMIMEEYEKTISQVVTMREDDRKKFEVEKEQLASERDDAVQHLRNMEIAFNDVHQKYEKCKEVIEMFKHNETEYKHSLAENKKTIQQQEENYTKLKEHATQKLEQANREIGEMRKAHSVEIAKLSAINKKMEIQVKTLEESIEQKKREVAELTKICDELITKVGH